jgi:hypothetical protein
MTSFSRFVLDGKIPPPAPQSSRATTVSGGAVLAAAGIGRVRFAEASFASLGSSGSQYLEQVRLLEEALVREALVACSCFLPVVVVLPEAGAPHSFSVVVSSREAFCAFVHGVVSVYVDKRGKAASATAREKGRLRAWWVTSALGKRGGEEEEERALVVEEVVGVEEGEGAWVGLVKRATHGKLKMA